MSTPHRRWGLWVLVLLLVPGAMWASGVRPNELPGNATTSPSWDPGRLLDDDYYREIDTWLADRTPSQDAGLWARYQLDYRLLGDASNQAVAVGDDGWLFSRSFTDVSCETLDAIVAPRVPDGAENAFTYLVPLTKAYWLDDLLEPHDRPPACSNAARERLRATLRDDPQGFDVNAAIDDDPLGAFYPRDPHWGPQGRVRVAEALIERFSPGLWEPDAVVSQPEEVVQGMTRFLGSNDIDTIMGTAIERDVELTIEKQTFGLGLLIWQRSTVADGAVIPGTTYMFGDSQGASIVPYIDQYFEELIFVGWLRAQVAPLPMDNLPAPDRVIVEAIDQWADEVFTTPAIKDVTDRLPSGQS